MTDLTYLRKACKSSGERVSVSIAQSHTPSLSCSLTPGSRYQPFLPFRKHPPPLLQPDAVKHIGYLQPMDRAGTTSPPAEPQFGPMTRHESESLAQRMRRNLTAVPSRVAARVRSLTGRDRQPSTQRDQGTHGTAHGQEQVLPVARSPAARSPSLESSRVREPHLEEEARGAAEAEPDRLSRTSRVRSRLTSMGRAIARPFRSSYHRSE